MSEHDNPAWLTGKRPAEVAADLYRRFIGAWAELDASGWQTRLPEALTGEALEQVVAQVQRATASLAQVMGEVVLIGYSDAYMAHSQYESLMMLTYDLRALLAVVHGYCQLLKLADRSESLAHSRQSLFSALGHLEQALKDLVPLIQSVEILGIRVDDVTYDEALAFVALTINQKVFLRQIATVNVEFIMAAQDDLAFRDVLNTTALNLPDGIGVVWAARQLGHPLRERVAGVDTVERIARQAGQAGWWVYFLGAAEGVAQKAADVLQARYPGFQCVGAFSGSPRVEEEDSIVERVRAAAPDVLLVAYGAPAQDKWIARNRLRLGVPVCMGVGGAFDFIAGVTRRAPRWLQRLGLEWLHRLLRQPWRWRRMLALPKFVWRVWRKNQPGR